VAAPPPGAYEDEDAPVVPLPPLIADVEETVEAPIPEELEEHVEGQPAPLVESAAVAAAIAQPEPARAAPPAPRREPPATLEMPARVSGRALHRVDPLASSGRRRFGFRRGGEEGPSVEVRDGRPPGRTLPRRVLEESGRRCGASSRSGRGCSRR